MSERSADMAAKRKHKNSGRLGSGEFQYTDGFNVGRAEPELKQDGPTKEQLHMQALFLNAVFEVEPAAQESLESILATLPMFVMDGELPKVEPDKIKQWCSRWHLNVRWCEEFAEQRVLQLWLESRNSRYSLTALKERAQAQELATQPFQDLRLVIDCGFWPITQLTRKEFKGQCQRLFEEKFKEFCHAVEVKAKAGMKRTREKREHDHFVWLARHLVKGEKAGDIKRFSANLEKTSVRAINKAITALARELELPIRFET